MYHIQNDFVMQPYNNGKGNQASVCILKSTKDKRNDSSSNSLKGTITEVIDVVGGIINLWRASALLRNS